jgi:hypothetical protein
MTPSRIEPATFRLVAQWNMYLVCLIDFKWYGQNNAVFIWGVNFKFSFEEDKKPRTVEDRNMKRHAPKQATLLTMTFDGEGWHNCEECTFSALRRWHFTKHWSAHTYLFTYLPRTPWNRDLLRKLTGSQLFNFPHFMEPEFTLPRLQVPATYLFPEPYRSSLCPHILLP